jgi:hypothetical protein
MKHAVNPINKHLNNKLYIILFFGLLSTSSFGQKNKYKDIIKQLKIVDEDDKKYRIKIQELGEKYGLQSKKVDSVWVLMNKADSINLKKVKSILDKYGWLGASEIGTVCNIALYRIIQHSDIKTQEHYLPLMREAVKNKKANASDLASLEDRVALRQGNKQIYGTQIGYDPKTHEYYVSPLEDPDNVDKRRAEAGLKPLSEVLEFYFDTWKLKWDVEQYKKDLPEILEKIKSKKSN